MLVRFKLTRTDYYYSSFWTFLTSKAIWLAVFALPFGFLITILQPPTLNQLLIISFIGISVIFLIFFLMVYVSVLAKLTKEPTQLHNYQILDLRSDGIFYFPAEGGKGVHSSFIYQLKESPRHFYLYLTPKHVILIPKRVVEIKAFRKLAMSYLIRLSDLMSLILR